MDDTVEKTVDRVLESRRRWTELFPTPRVVFFEAPALVCGYCADCRCCCVPQPESEPWPMPLLERQISERTPCDFYLLDRQTACIDQRGCRSCGDQGCRLDRELRPVACNLFPFVIVDGRLGLYRFCPVAVLTPREQVQDIAFRIRDWLQSWDQRDIRRISCSSAKVDFCTKCLDLGLPLAMG